MARAWVSTALRLLTPNPCSPPLSTTTIRQHSTSAVEALPPHPSQTRTPPLTNTTSELVQKSRIYNLSFYQSLYPMRSYPKRKIKQIHPPTHYVEVSYKLQMAVVFYQLSIAHIPHGIKERNPVLITSGARRGQNT